METAIDRQYAEYLDAEGDADDLLAATRVEHHSVCELGGAPCTHVAKIAGPTRGLVLGMLPEDTRAYLRQPTARRSEAPCTTCRSTVGRPVPFAWTKNCHRNKPDTYQHNVDFRVDKGQVINRGLTLD